MKINDKETLSIAAAVSDVLEGKTRKEEAKYPHDMFHPKTGEKEVAKTEKDHEELSKKGYTHEKPEVKEVEEPRAKGEKDFKDKHSVKKTYGPGAVKEENEDDDEEEVDEALQPVTKIRFDYKDTLPKSPKPSDVGGLKQDWKSEKMSVQSAVKSLGGLVTDSEAPSTSNKFVGTISIGTRGDASKLSNAAIQKAVKSKGAEIQSNQFEGYKKDKKVDEVLGFDKDNPNKSDDKKDEKEGNEFTMALAQARKNGDKDFVVSGKKYMVKDQKDDDDKEEVEEAKSKFPKALVKKATELALKMGGNMTGASKKIEKMKKGLSDDPEVKAALQLANEEVSEEVVEEAIKMNEAEDKKAKYKAFFDKALKKFGVDSPAELKGDKKKEFFDYVDANYEAENETD